jgi:hypothetical protein
MAVERKKRENRLRLLVSVAVVMLQEHFIISYTSPVGIIAVEAAGKG